MLSRCTFSSFRPVSLGISQRFFSATTNLNGSTPWRAEFLDHYRANRTRHLKHLDTIEKASSLTVTQRTFYNRILFILRHHARRDAIPIRPDGYVNIPYLLNHRGYFHSVGLANILNLITNDPFSRFELMYQCPPKSKEPEPYVRAREGHTMKSVKVDFELYTPSYPREEAVFISDEVQWSYIRSHGIPRLFGIPISLTHSENGIPITTSDQPALRIFLSLQRATSAGIQFFSSKGGILVTDGDSQGLLRPKLFTRVLRSRAFSRSVLQDE